MGAVQTTYTANLAIGSPGDRADTITFDAVSRLVQPATLAFGRAVIQGTAADQVNVGAGGVFIGISVRDIGLDPAQGDQYVQGDTAAIMIRGSIFITATDVVVAGNPVYRTAAGVLVATASGNTLIPNCIFETGGGVGALVKVRLG
jgi:hypothetical protein